jgi:hypothetical protein
MPNATLHLRAGKDSAYKVTIEPWAVEFEVNPGEDCRIVARHPTETPTLTCEIWNQNLIVYIDGGGTNFSFMRNGVVEF